MWNQSSLNSIFEINQNTQYSLLDLILVKGWNMIKKNVSLRQNPKCCQSCIRQQELLQSSEGASDYFCCDWLTCQQLSNHQQLQKKKKEKNFLMWGSGLFVLWFDFCGSRCRRNATERGIFNNLQRQTVWRHTLLKPGHIHLFQRFLWTPTVSLKMESRATVRVNRLPDSTMTGCGMTCKRAFDVITRTALLSQWEADSI